MPKLRFSEAEIIQILEKTREWSVDDILANYPISRATLYRWRVRFLGKSNVMTDRESQLEARVERLEQRTAVLTTMYASLVVDPTGAADSDIRSMYQHGKSADLP